MDKPKKIWQFGRYEHDIVSGIVLYNGEYIWFQQCKAGGFLDCFFVDFTEQHDTDDAKRKFMQEKLIQHDVDPESIDQIVQYYFASSGYDPDQPYITPNNKYCIEPDNSISISVMVTPLPEPVQNYLRANPIDFTKNLNVDFDIYHIEYCCGTKFVSFMVDWQYKLYRLPPDVLQYYQEYHRLFRENISYCLDHDPNLEKLEWHHQDPEKFNAWYRNNPRIPLKFEEYECIGIVSDSDFQTNDPSICSHKS